MDIDDLKINDLDKMWSKDHATVIDLLSTAPSHCSALFVKHLIDTNRADEANIFCNMAIDLHCEKLSDGQASDFQYKYF